MDRLSIRKQNHPKVPILGLRNSGPALDALISLDMLMLRMFYDP